MKKISHKLMLLFLLTSMLPLILIGGIATVWSYISTRQAIEEHNQQLARIAAQRINSYIEEEVALLYSLAQNIERVGLSPWQKETIVRNHVIRFPSLESVMLVDSRGDLVVSSELDEVNLDPYQQAFQYALHERRAYRSPMVIAEDLVPKLVIGVPVLQRGKSVGVLLANMNMLYLWEIVDTIRVGKAGNGLLIDTAGQLIAHGDRRGKPLVLQQQDLTPIFATSHNVWGEQVLKSFATVSATGWRLVVQQPLSEAFAGARYIVLALSLISVLVLAVAVFVGYLGGKSLVQPVEKLMEGVQHLAKGELDYKVPVSGRDELARLADAFNKMGDDLDKLQGELATRERAAAFGRIAAALAHDLKHPIQNLKLNSDLLTKKYDDAGFREHFHEVMQRELESLNYLVTRLRDLARPKRLVKIALNIDAEIGQVLDSFKESLNRQHVQVEFVGEKSPTLVLGDMLAIRRMLSNIFENAIQAMSENPHGGYLQVQVKQQLPTSMAQIAIKDNGCGIAKERLKSIFDDFATTKDNSRFRGMGLGMSVIKEICESHDGSIEVQSEEGVGTTVVVHLPLAKGAVAELYGDVVDSHTVEAEQLHRLRH